MELIQQKVVKFVADAQANKDWMNGRLAGVRFTRTEAGTVKAWLASPFTGREIVAETFPLRKLCDRGFVETLVANWEGHEVAAYTDDLLDASLLRDITL